MKVKEAFKIKENTEIAKNTFKMVLDVDNLFKKGMKIGPGQFVNLYPKGTYLPRPISVGEVSKEKGTITLIYKVVGEGTRILSRLSKGHSIDTMLSLGTGYDLELKGNRPILIGGGSGLPPMIGLYKELVKLGAKPLVLLGFKHTTDVFGIDNFDKNDLYLSIEGPNEPKSDENTDFTCKTKAMLKENIFFEALPHEVLKKLEESGVIKDITGFAICGPEAMIKACGAYLSEIGIKGEVSLEARLGCGFGACAGCAIPCKTEDGGRTMKGVCKAGPVFKFHEIIWE